MSKKLVFGAVALAAASLVGMPEAGAIPLTSDAGQSCSYQGGQAGGAPAVCTTVEVAAHPSWQPAAGTPYGGVWISYGPTGYAESLFQPFVGSTPVYRTSETFTLAASATLDLFVWSDDTAGVYIDGVLVFAPNLTQNTCADGPIGCEPGEGAHIVQVLAAGDHEIEFETFQVGTATNTTDNPFGLLYSGNLEVGNVSVPEPGTLALLGAGLLAVVGASRRRRTRA